MIIKFCMKTYIYTQYGIMAAKIKAAQSHGPFEISAMTLSLLNAFGKPKYRYVRVFVYPYYNFVVSLDTICVIGFD